MKIGRILSHRASRVCMLSVAAVVASAAAAPPSSAVGSALDQPTVVSAVPSTHTPNIADGTVYSITQVGSLIVVGGSFSSVSNRGSTTTMTRTDALAFDASTGTVSTTFAPTLDGTVRAVAPGPTPNTVYLGGSFTNVNGVRSKSITLLDTQTGSIVSGFKPPALNGVVYSIATAGSRLYLGGTFTTASGVAHGGLVTLNPTSGALDAFTNVQLAGHHNYDGTGANGAVGPRAIAVNPAGSRLIVIGNFKTANGLARDQAVLIDIDGTSAAVDPNWATLQYTAACFRNAFDTYMTDVQYSADGSYFVVTATGGSGTNSDGTNSLCDTAARWKSSDVGSNVKPVWVDYTGQDTLWSIAITGTAVYVGGHQRWLNNSNGFDYAGAGAVPRPGIAALDPKSGVPLTWNPGRNPRGAGAYALYASPAGLYVGSDTDYIGNFQYKRQKIAFFPLAGGATPASTATTQLPSNLYMAGQLTNGGSGPDTLSYRAVSGSRIGPLTTVANTGVAWGSSRGAFMVGNYIFYGATDGNFYRTSFDGNTVGTPSVMDAYDDPYWDSVSTGSGQTYQGAKPSYYSQMSSVAGEFYSDGRLYYALLGQSQLYSRWFSPDSGIIGSQEFTVAGGNFSNIAGMVLSGTTLYYANRADGTLHTLLFVNGVPDGSHDTVVSGPSIDGNDWRTRGMFLYGSPTFPNQPPSASATWSCAQLNCSFDGTSSSDPDGSIASYSWDFGDGSHGTGPTPTHGYPQAGSYTVSLVVTDDRGAQSAPWTAQVTVTAPVTQVNFVARAGFNGATATPSVVVPAAVKPGDTELLAVSAGTAGVTTTVPNGWAKIAQLTNSPLETTIFQRIATASDAGSRVSVPLASSATVDLELVDYSGVAAGTPVLTTAVDSFTATHTAPSVAVTAGGSWVVSYWADRTSNTTTWTLPSSVSERGTGYGAGGGHVDSSVADSGAPVASGQYPSRTASSGATSGKGDMVSIVLTPATT